MAIKALLFAVLVILVVVGMLLYVNDKQANAPGGENDSQSTKEFDKSKHSLTSPDSIWVIVNKQNSLPINFTPKELVVPQIQLRLAANEQQMQLNQKAQKDLQAMFEAAQKDGVNLVFGSGYRSAELQKQFYDSYVANDGQAAADTYSARPGHSEHQTGLGVDITSPSGECHLEICWAETPEGKWVAKNASKHGFIIRYPKGKEKITGYQYEPWHLRYVGQDLAKEISVTSQTLEEFFGLPAAPNYN